MPLATTYTLPVPHLKPGHRIIAALPMGTTASKVTRAFVEDGAIFEHARMTNPERYGIDGPAVAEHHIVTVESVTDHDTHVTVTVLVDLFGPYPYGIGRYADQLQIVYPGDGSAAFRVTWTSLPVHEAVVARDLPEEE
jgi:hypothetical protein